MRFVLLNKDNPWLLFSCDADEYGDKIAHEIEWYTELRPVGYLSLQSFLERRKAPKHRKHIEDLLEQYGCNTLDGFLRVTHALSLNDTFWVKEASSSLTWNEVSLYQNEFNDLISQAAFDGVVSSMTISSTSPEFGTDGQYAKCWVREGKDIWLYKRGSATFEIEPVSEFLSSQIAEIICPGAVQYDLAFFRGQLISKCLLFTSEQVGLAKAYDLIRSNRTIAGIMDYFSSVGCADSVRRMFVLDALILNTDRHFGNFGMLFDNNTMELLGMAPIYDNNRSLLFDLDDDQLSNADWYIRRCRPRIGSSDFVQIAKAVMTSEIISVLKNLKGFSFAPHPDIEINDARLKTLSEIVNNQINAILNA